MIGGRCAIAEEKKQAKPRAACGGIVFREDVGCRVRDRGLAFWGSPPKIDYDDDNDHDHDVLGLIPETCACGSILHFRIYLWASKVYRSLIFFAW
jgi:hypothetical protein